MINLNEVGALAGPDASGSKLYGNAPQGQHELLVAASYGW